MSAITDALFELNQARRAIENYRKLRRADRDHDFLPSSLGVLRSIERAMSLIQALPPPRPITKEELEAFGWRLLYPDKRAPDEY